MPQNDSVNHRLPSGPVVMEFGSAGYEVGYKPVISPAGVILPTQSLSNSVNHMLPSGPGASCKASSPGTVYSVTLPSSVIFPMFPSAYHMLPSGPAAIPVGPAGTANSWILPVGEILPILPAIPTNSVN